MSDDACIFELVQPEWPLTLSGLSVEGRHDAVANVAEALAECLPRQAQEFGRLELIVVGELQDGREQNAIDFQLRLGV